MHDMISYHTYDTFVAFGRHDDSPGKEVGSAGVQNFEGVWHGGKRKEPEQVVSRAPFLSHLYTIYAKDINVSYFLLLPAT